MDVEQRVQGFARQLREVLCELAPDERPAGYDAFPLGWCGLASELLALLLNKRLGSSCVFEYVSGQLPGTFQTHSWVETEGMLIDISADQFEGIEESVWITHDRSWHGQFVETGRYAPQEPSPQDRRIYGYVERRVRGEP